MPELPDVTVYLEAIAARTANTKLLRAKLLSPFLLRTAAPPLTAFFERKVTSFFRLGKRLVFGFEGDYFSVLHLMVAGRLHWQDGDKQTKLGQALAVWWFERGTLWLTEAGTKKRAALHLVEGRADLAAHDPGGLELADADASTFRAVMRRENHTLKRALTDPSILSGIGNAYSDEILHRAKLSPVLLTQKIGDAELDRLFACCVDELNRWTAVLREQATHGFPEHVTAFRPEMAVHGKWGQPCPVCATPVQRIRYASNETNYCPTCQTGGKLLADRALSRLLGADWPKTVEELERKRRGS